jgi:quercetin dioxygenase-like cupin family protein
MVRMQKRSPVSHFLITKFTSALACLGLLACGNSATPSAPEQPFAAKPNFTASSGVTNTGIARGNLGTFQLQSKFGQYTIELKSHDDTDVEVRSLVFVPGALSGWHTHPGPVIVAVKTGALTVYDASDPNCQPKVYPTGTAFIEGTTVHNVRNEGTVNAEAGDLFFIPAGGLRRIEADAPANCPP